jgi:pimeloyl-ACP methyl ester carboxylesterase
MQDLVFVHGMFQNPESWNRWLTFFSEKGYRCFAPAWPCHEGVPATLREHPPAALGELTLDEVLARVEHTVAGLDNPIVIGHSVGGLVAQILLNRGAIKAAVAISPVAPNGMFDFDWDFIRIGARIANPLKGDDPIYMDEKTFHETFANALSESEAAVAYDHFATHDSRNVLRGCLGRTGRIDFDASHGPLLLVSAELDKIIPAHLVQKNFEAYTEGSCITSHKEFKGRSHFICGEPGWVEVAAYVAEWLEQTALTPASLDPAGLAAVVGMK